MEARKKICPKAMRVEQGGCGAEKGAREDVGEYVWMVTCAGIMRSLEGMGRSVEKQIM